MEDRMKLLHSFSVRALLIILSLCFLSLAGGHQLFARDMTAPQTAIQAHNAFMQKAIDEAWEGISKGHGGPFGCVIVKNGAVIAAGHNQVLKKHDATCHGKMEALRMASSVSGTHDLSGCELYTTGEPCPMCLAACLWANISKVFYGCTIADNASIGFRDESMDKLFGGRQGMQGFLFEVDREACLRLFDAYRSLNARRY